MSVVRPSLRLFGLFPLALALGCGKGGGDRYLDEGSDDGGGSLVLGAGDASVVGLDAHIEQKGITVTFVTLSCNGPCADVKAAPAGGTPPYTFQWDDGSKNAARQVCPA